MLLITGIVYMLLITGTVANFVDTILPQATQATAEEKTNGMDIDDMCMRAESMANEIVETIVISDETLPGDPTATNTYPPSSL